MTTLKERQDQSMSWSREVKEREGLGAREGREGRGKKKRRGTEKQKKKEADRGGPVRNYLHEAAPG